MLSAPLGGRGVSWWCWWSWLYPADLACLPCVLWPLCLGYSWVSNQKTEINWKIRIFFEFFNRPGVAGAVLQTPSWLTDLITLFLQIFKTPSLPNHNSLGADILRGCSPSTTCHPPTCVTCHVSYVTCHMSLVTCQMSIDNIIIIIIFFFLKSMELVVPGSVFNGAYPV